MGLIAGTLRIVAELKSAGLIAPGSRIADIGEQQLSDQFLCADELLDEVYRLFAKPRIALGQPCGAANFAETAPFSRRFWQSLGLEYIAIDLRGSDIIKLDLNRDQIPRELRLSQDIVLNYGTTEHIANQDNVFRCIHDLAKPNGIMIHYVPSQGLITHGLLNYTPKFFWHLCRDNLYEVLSLRLDVREGAVAMPANVINFGVHFGKPEPLPPQDQITFRNCLIDAVLRKPHDRPFVTPLDAV